MDGKVKIIIGVAAVAMIGMVGYSKLSASLNKDPAVTSIQAEFVGEVSPGENFTKSMFNVKGVTETGKLVKLNDFSSKTTAAAQNGDSCEVEITSQGQSATAIVNITREPVFEQNIGYPNEEDATVICYSNGDLEFEGKGELTNFGTSLPWKDCEYTHVYIDETLQIESMDSWFEGNENLVYCTNIPKSVKTMKKTFANCKALEKAPDYFQCSNLKIMDYAFSGCEALKEIDILPVNVSSAQYAFEGCISLQKPADLSKTSNLQDISGLHNGCSNLREATEIPNSVIYMSETFMNCLNIKAAVRFPEKVLDISSAYAGDSALEIGASIPEGVTDFSGCYQGCSALSGTLEINSDTEAFDSALVDATTNGDKLAISGNSGNLLAIQKDAKNSNIILADPEAASQQNERMLREQEV